MYYLCDITDVLSLVKYRCTNLSDITDVLSLVTVQMYQPQQHYRCTDLSDSKDVLTDITDVLTSMPLRIC